MLLPGLLVLEWSEVIFWILGGFVATVAHVIAAPSHLTSMSCKALKNCGSLVNLVVFAYLVAWQRIRLARAVFLAAAVAMDLISSISFAATSNKSINGSSLKLSTDLHL